MVKSGCGCVAHSKQDSPYFLMLLSLIVTQEQSLFVGDQMIWDVSDAIHFDKELNYNFVTVENQEPLISKI